MDSFVICNITEDEMLWDEKLGWVNDNPTVYTEEQTRSLTLPENGDWQLLHNTIKSQ